LVASISRSAASQSLDGFLSQLCAVQEQLELEHLRAEQLAESLALSEAELAELRSRVDERNQSEHNGAAPPAAPDPTAVQLKQELLLAEQRSQAAQHLARETQSLLNTAQKMLEGQANHLQDLSRREEEAQLALERERLFAAEFLYFFQNCTTTSGLDPERIPRLRNLLQSHSSDLQGAG
jgi:hypothetical protein